MKYSSLAFAILSGSCLFAFSAVTEAQVLLNGSFESPTLPTSPLQVTGAGAAWAPSVATSAISTYLNSTGTSNGVGNTPYGNQLLVLSGGTSVSQFIISGFTAGGTYVLGADYANVNSAPASSFILSVSGTAASALSTYLVTSGGPYGTATIPFQSAVLVFTANASGSATITLGDSAGGGLIAVDNVALYGFPSGVIIPTQVPEPTTWALMLSGLAVVFWQFRRSRI